MNRTGNVTFGDASLNVWEESVDEKTFKKQVFKRIIQQLNRLGWSCEIPQEKIDTYGFSFATRSRYCQKGDLKADLRLCGRHIEFKMFQNINAPDRPDWGGRYQGDKEQHMPYLMRLEMERTRRRIRDYLCNVFDSYEFKPGKPEAGPGKLTATEFVFQTIADSWHYVPELGHARISMPGRNDKSADGKTVTHGCPVYTTDMKGRIIKGTAYYNLNSSWWVVTGKYGYTCAQAGDIYLENPGNLRAKRNQRTRRGRLEAKLADAIRTMDFQRAELFKQLLFGQQPLYCIWSKKHEAWFRSNYSGYTGNQIDAGKYTLDEIKSTGYWGDIEENRLKLVPLHKEAA